MEMASKEFAKAGETPQSVRITPDYPCYHCGNPASSGTIYRGEIITCCRDCAGKIVRKYEEKKGS